MWKSFTTLNKFIEFHEILLAQWHRRWINNNIITRLLILPGLVHPNRHQATQCPAVYNLQSCASDDSLYMPVPDFEQHVIQNDVQSSIAVVVTYWTGSPMYGGSTLTMKHCKLSLL